MKRIILIILLLLLLAGLAYAQFGTSPFERTPCEFGIGPFGECLSGHGSSLKTETNDYLLLETGGSILLE
jgi:hypothetical protein